MLLRQIVLFPLAACLCLAVAMPTQGEDGESQNKKSRMPRQSSRRDDDSLRRVQRVSGKVERTKQIDLRGTKDKELVVMLRTQDDKKRIVDLGATRKLGSHRVRTGDKITVEGRVMKIGRFQMLVANELKTGDRWFTIERPIHPRTKPGSYSIANQTRKIEGRIVDTRRVKLRDSDQKHLIAHVKKSDGKFAVVDFGQADQRQGDKLEEGNRVTIHGRDMLVDGRKLVLAFKVEGEDNESIKITREGSSQPSRR